MRRDYKQAAGLNEIFSTSDLIFRTRSHSTDNVASVAEENRG